MLYGYDTPLSPLRLPALLMFVVVLWCFVVQCTVYGRQCFSFLVFLCVDVAVAVWRLLSLLLLLLLSSVVQPSRLVYPGIPGAAAAVYSSSYYVITSSTVYVVAVHRGSGR